DSPCPGRKRCKGDKKAAGHKEPGDQMTSFLPDPKPGNQDQCRKKGPCKMPQAVLSRHLFPGQHWSRAHQEKHNTGKRCKGTRIIGWADGNLVSTHSLQYQRVEGSSENDSGAHQKKQIIKQQCGFPA